MDDFQEQPGGTSDSDAAGNTAAEDSNNLAAQVAEDDTLYGPDANSQEQADEGEEEEEVEIGDRKLALPKSVAEKLKTERMLNADYTQKTQALAEERRQVTAEREQVQKQWQSSQEHLEYMADLRSINKQLKEIEDMNLAQYVQTDPGGVMEWQEKRRALEQQRATLAGTITQKQNEQALSEQQSFAKRVQDAEAYIGREIKGINAERVAALEKYAVLQGMDVRAYSNAIINTPQVAVMAHKAELYDALMKKQAPKPQPTPAAKPAIRIAGASATVKRDPTQMSDAEFAAHRRKVSQRR